MNIISRRALVIFLLSKLETYNAKFIAKSNSLYLQGAAWKSNPNKLLFLSKQDMNGNLIWNLIVNTQPTDNGFDVAPNEDYLYFIPQTSSLIIGILNATDGSFISTRNSTAYSIANGLLILTVSLDSSTIYFTSYSPLYLWKTSVSNLNIYWVTFANEQNAHKIFALDSYQLFINIEIDTQKLSLVKRIELSETSTQNRWGNKIACKQVVNATDKHN